MTTTQDARAPHDERTLFVLADEALDRVVAQVADEQWGRRTAAEVTTSAGEDPTLREVIGYHAYDDAWVPAMLAGRTMDDGGPALEDDLLGEDPRAGFAAIVEQACTAARALDDLDSTVHLSYGPYPAREYLWHITTFRTLRAVEIARLIGVDDTLPDELVAGVTAFTVPNLEQWRAMGIFGPEVQAPADATPQERLLAMTGRRPR